MQPCATPSVSPEVKTSCVLGMACFLGLTLQPTSEADRAVCGVLSCCSAFHWLTSAPPI